MSKSNKNNNKTAPEAVEQKKVQTKYDQKLQRRKEEAERAKKEQRKSRIITAVVVVLLAAFVLSFPIRSAIAVNGEYISVNGEKVTQVEFDYNYALAKASYLNMYGNYLSMYGMDMSTLDSQQYSEELTFGEYFEQMAVDKITDTKALKLAAEAEGFTYDTAEEYATTIADMKAAAEAEGVSYKQYLKTIYGPLATESRLKESMEETLYTAAFFNQKSEEKMPTLDEITAYYEEHKDDYDSIDYHMTIVEAELPTTAPDGSVPTDETGKEVAYEPTEEEIATAMAAAKEKADEAAKTVAQDGEAYTNVNLQMSYVNALIQDFLFDESRQVGDTYVAEDAAYNRYLVVSFDGRYLDETPTNDVRMVMSTITPSQAMLAEWKAGEATEESFIALVNKYDEAGNADGYVESLATSYMPEEMKAWLTATDRKAGDTFAIDVADDANYVVYYLEPNDAGWIVNIRGELLNETLNSYLEEIGKDITVEDPKGRLEYLKVEANSAE